MAAEIQPTEKLGSTIGKPVAEDLELYGAGVLDKEAGVAPASPRKVHGVAVSPFSVY